MNPETNIDLRDYLEACNDAAKRTRGLTIIVMIACVLMSYSFLNTWRTNWKLRRVQNINDIHSLSVRSKLGPIPEVGTDEYDLYKERYKQLYSLMLKQYVDSYYTLPVPFFGIGIDISDVAPLGGFTLVLILFLFRLSLTRELDNLRLSFERAQVQSQLTNFYYLLAMRQVLVIPLIEGKSRSKFLSTSTKSISIMPFIIYLTGALIDFGVVIPQSGFSIELPVFYILASDFIFSIMIGILSYMCFQRWKRLDTMWDYYWGKVLEERTERVRKQEPVVETPIVPPKRWMRRKKK